MVDRFLYFFAFRLASLAHMQELGEEAYQCHVTQCQSMVKSLQYELFRITNQME